MPATCPSCGTNVEKLPEEVAIFCPNPRCPAKVNAAIFHFSRRFAMDIDHLGEALIEQLTSAGLVKDVADLYALALDQVEALERMGKKSAQNVIDSLAASKDRTLDRLLTGLGIDHVGQVAARQLAEAAGSLETLLAWSEGEIDENVGRIAGFGPKMVASVQAFLHDPVERALLEKLREHGVSRPQPRATVASSGPLLGQSFGQKRHDISRRRRKSGQEQARCRKEARGAGDRRKASRRNAPGRKLEWCDGCVESTATCCGRLPASQRLR
jgi:DNA ligase (NAD+)